MRTTSPIGVLLTNLGTPDEPTPSALRRYLKEFLSDRRVVDLPRPLWWLILNGIILNTRPKKSAKLYQSIWQNEWTACGSPLLAISKRQASGVQRLLDDNQRAHAEPKHLSPAQPTTYVVELGMRYGNPSIASALARLRERGARRILVFPLYPQYSASTTASTIDAVYAALAPSRDIPELRFINSYATDAGYINALADSVRRFWTDNGPCDTLLFSFHGIPKRYANTGDPYPIECEQTATALKTCLGITEATTLLCYQSRFGFEPWLEPYTDRSLETLGQLRNKQVDIICPGFSADCLETLQEIACENRELFLKSGGTRYRYIPALNDKQAHLELLRDLILHHTAGWDAHQFHIP